MLKNNVFICILEIFRNILVILNQKEVMQVVDTICDWLLKKIMEKDATIDEEKSEIIYYGLQNLVGELPKGFFILLVAWLCGVFKLVLMGTVVFLVYRAFAGGVHLKTHLSCFLVSTFLVVGGTIFAKEFLYENTFLVYTILGIFNFALAALYAPADTENRPIMKESQRNRQKIESVIMVGLIYLISTFIIKNHVISNIFMYMITVESLMITPFAYKIFKNKSGEERRNEILKSM